jgi:3-(3-hydroxy-phenyl)propionate hydroxylase
MREFLAEPERGIVIAGGGPTGLMLAGELALAGVEVTVLERRPRQELAGSRAGGLHSRTIEIMDQRGIAERFLAEGQIHRVAPFAEAMLDLGDLPSRHPYTLGLWQRHIERILGEWVGELGVRVHLGREAVGFAQDEDGVEVELADGGRIRAAFLVGCDGGRSAVRKAAGIDFPGWEATKSALIAAVEMAEEPEFGVSHGEHGISGIGPTEEGGPVRVVVTERELTRGEEPTLDDLRTALVAVYGTDFGVHDPTWISRFTDATRQAASYRQGRILLVGDSAHVHYPAGGQGLQHGVQDAVNLGWKLAQVVKGIAPAALLDTYEAERHPPTAASLRRTMAASALHRGDPRTAALRTTLTELATMDEPRRHLAAQLHGLDIHYDLGAGHPLLGRRMPDLDLATADGPLRTYELLHRARPVLLDLGAPGGLGFGPPGGFDSSAPGGLGLGPWEERVQLVRASYAGVWELPAIGAVPAPTAVLVRPDGHVAWVAESGDPDPDGLAAALTTWFGPAT